MNSLNILIALLGVLATLLASFSGAWFAFLFQSRERAKEVRKVNITAANKALFTLLQQANSLSLFQHDMIDPHRDNPSMFLAMLPILMEDDEDFKYDYQSLAFLLNTKYKQLLMDFFIQQKKYQTCIQLINKRSQIHLNHVQPVLAEANIREGVDYTMEIFEATLGPLLFKTIQRATDHVVTMVDKSMDSYEEFKDEALKTFTELFPEGNFLDYRLRENDD